MEHRGQLELLLLASLGTAPAHGYGLIERLRQRSGGAFDYPEGTIYPALHRLEAAGLVSSRWEDAGPRRRRVYALTRRGRSALTREKSSWRAFVAAVEAVTR